MQKYSIITGLLLPMNRDRKDNGVSVGLLRAVDANCIGAINGVNSTIKILPNPPLSKEGAQIPPFIKGGLRGIFRSMICRSSLGVERLSKHRNKSFSIKIKLLCKIDKGLGI